jgi:hypothetical protein
MIEETVAYIFPSVWTNKGGDPETLRPASPTAGPQTAKASLFLMQTINVGLIKRQSLEGGEQ